MRSPIPDTGRAESKREAFEREKAERQLAVDAIERMIRDSMQAWYQWLSTQVKDREIWESVPWWAKRAPKRLDGYWYDMERYVLTGDSAWVENLFRVIDHLHLSDRSDDNMPQIERLHSCVEHIVNGK